MVYRTVFEPRPPRRYCKMNTFFPAGVILTPKPGFSLSHRNTGADEGLSASIARAEIFPFGNVMRPSNHLASTLNENSGNYKKEQEKNFSGFATSIESYSMPPESQGKADHKITNLGATGSNPVGCTISGPEQCSQIDTARKFQTLRP